MPEEKKEGLLDLLGKASSVDELVAGLPKNLTNKLGEGEKGVNRAIALLVGLAPFAPEPATFDRNAFNFIVAFDEETGEPLPPEESQKMIDVALEAGLLKKADKEERYISNPKVGELVNKLFKE